MTRRFYARHEAKTIDWASSADPLAAIFGSFWCGAACAVEPVDARAIVSVRPDRSGGSCASLAEGVVVVSRQAQPHAKVTWSRFDLTPAAMRRRHGCRVQHRATRRPARLAQAHAAPARAHRRLQRRSRRDSPDAGEREQPPTARAGNARSLCDARRISWTIDRSPRCGLDANLSRITALARRGASCRFPSTPSFASRACTQIGSLRIAAVRPKCDGFRPRWRRSTFVSEMCSAPWRASGHGLPRAAARRCSMVVRAIRGFMPCRAGRGVVERMRRDGFGGSARDRTEPAALPAGRGGRSERRCPRDGASHHANSSVPYATALQS